MRGFNWSASLYLEGDISEITFILEGMGGGGGQRDLDITVTLGVRKDDTVTDLDIKVASASFQVCAVCCLLRQETKLPRIVLSTQPSKIVPGNR